MGIDGERLKKLHLSRGLSPGQIADKLGISRQGYNQYEDGTTRNPRKLEALASFFNVTTDFLLGKDSDYAAQDYTNDDFIVVPLFYTTAPLSDVAEEFAGKLGVRIRVKPMGEYPLIKCNINRTTGEHIYHLPFDQQYNSCLIRDDGEFYAWTVAEAEDAGFRRAFRWHGNKTTH